MFLVSKFSILTSLSTKNKTASTCKYLYNRVFPSCGCISPHDFLCGLLKHLLELLLGPFDGSLCGALDEQEDLALPLRRIPSRRDEDSLGDDSRSSQLSNVRDCLAMSDLGRDGGMSVRG